MRTRIGAMLLTGGVAVATIGISAPQALAATWTVSPGGNITAVSNKTVLTDTTTGNALTCVSTSTSKASKSTATLKSGSGLSGAGIGSIKTLVFNNCTGPAGLTFSVSVGNLPYALNASSFNATSGTTTGSITGIHATLSGSGCTATVDGTGATADNGKVKAKYINGTHKLKVVASGGNLHVYNVSGCLGLINSGDATTFVATYNVSPAQTITSP